MPYKGRQVNIIGYAKESTRNTAVTTPTKWFPARSFSGDVKNSYREDTSAMGRREGLMDKQLTSQQYEAELELTLDPQFVGEWLFHAYGQVTSNTALGATTHTFNSQVTGANAILPATCTIHRLLADRGWKYTNGMNVSKLEFNITKDDATCKVSFMGQTETDNGSTPTVTFSLPSTVLLGRHLTAKYATTVAGLSSGTAFTVRSLTVTYDLGSKPVAELGTLTDEIIGNGTRHEVKFSGIVRGSDYYSQFKSGTPLAFEFDCNGANLASLGTSALKPRIDWQVAPSIVDLTHTGDNDDLVTFDATVQCEWSESDGFALKTILQNTVASY